MLFSTSPPFLKANDRVGVLAMASKVVYDDILPAISILKNDWQLEVIEGKTLRGQYHQFAGTDQERLEDLQMMLDDPSIKAIFSARGGYGSSRLLDKLAFKKFKKYPKWVVGFSDITALHCHLHQLGFQSVHSIVPKQFAKIGYETALESLKNILFGGEINYEIPSNPLNRNGQAEGQLVGGNLCLLTHLLGSRSELDTRHKIFFIEDVGEPLYNIDRMMVQLKRANKLKNLAGLVIGQFTELRDNENTPFGKSVYEIIAEHIVDYDYPVCFDFPIGHDEKNNAVRIGETVKLVVGTHNSQLTTHNSQLTTHNSQLTTHNS